MGKKLLNIIRMWAAPVVVAGAVFLYADAMNYTSSLNKERDALIEEIRLQEQEANTLLQQIEILSLRLTSESEIEKYVNKFYEGGEIDESKKIALGFEPVQRYPLPLGEFGLDDMNSLQRAFYIRALLASIEAKPLTSKSECNQECLDGMLNEVLRYIDSEVPTKLNRPSAEYGPKNENAGADYNAFLNRVRLLADDFGYRLVAHEGAHAQHIRDEPLAELISLESLANMALDGNSMAKAELFSVLRDKIKLSITIANISGREDSSFFARLEEGERLMAELAPHFMKDYQVYTKNPLIAALKAITGEQVTYNGVVLDGLYKVGELLQPSIKEELEKGRMIASQR